MNTNNINFDNVKNLTFYLFLPFLILLIINKINILLINYHYKKQLTNFNKKNVKQISLFIIQILLFLLIQNSSFFLPLKLASANLIYSKLNSLIYSLIPIMSFSTLAQLILMLLFLFKARQIKKLHYFRISLIIYCFLWTIFQFLTLTWQIRHLLFINFGNFIDLIALYFLMTFIVIKMFNSDLLMLQSFVNLKIKVLKNKKDKKILEAYEKAIANYSNRKLIMKVWNFKSAWIISVLKKLQEIKCLANRIKSAFIMFFISTFNFLNKNIIKDQAIIINGWKCVVRK